MTMSTDLHRQFCIEMAVERELLQTFVKFCA